VLWSAENWHHSLTDPLLGIEKMPSEDDKEVAASAMERRQYLREDSYDAMNGKKLECYLVRCKDTLAV
jgi:hypothetical protein